MFFLLKKFSGKTIIYQYILICFIDKFFEMVTEFSDMLSIISQENRLQIIGLLSLHKELCVCEIIDQLGLKQNLVSHHLMILKNIGVIRSRKDGKKVYYSIDKINYNKFTKHIKKIFNI